MLLLVSEGIQEASFWARHCPWILSCGGGGSAHLKEYRIPIKYNRETGDRVLISSSWPALIFPNISCYSVTQLSIRPAVLTVLSATCAYLSMPRQCLYVRGHLYSCRLFSVECNVCTFLYVFRAFIRGIRDFNGLRYFYT